MDSAYAVGLPATAFSEGMTGEALEQAVAAFSARPTDCANVIQNLHAKYPATFALASFRLLGSHRDQTPGIQYLAAFVQGRDTLMDLLLNESSLSPDAAIAMACRLTKIEPRLDTRLMNRMLAEAGGEVPAVRASLALWVLQLVEAISDCSRLSSFLVRFLSHPSPQVRSKVARLLGRANLNLARIRQLLASEDPRVRANAVESLWGLRCPNVREVLRDASQDRSSRVSINALLELCRWGDREAQKQLCDLVGSEDPIRRSGAAWAMGESGMREFGTQLYRLAEDEHPGTRDMAEKALQKLGLERRPPVRSRVPIPVPIPPPNIDEMPAAQPLAVQPEAPALEPAMPQPEAAVVGEELVVSSCPAAEQVPPADFSAPRFEQSSSFLDSVRAIFRRGRGKTRPNPAQ